MRIPGAECAHLYSSGCTHAECPAVLLRWSGGSTQRKTVPLWLVWHHEAGIQVLRMILSGAFEKFPNLQLIAGHWGEMVPFFLSQLDQALPQSVTKLNRTITETFQQNIYVTPSGIFDYPQLKFCIEVLGANRIIHSVDFPFISSEGALTFIENAPISDEDKEKMPTKMRKHF